MFWSAIRGSFRIAGLQSRENLLWQQNITDLHARNGISSRLAIFPPGPEISPCQITRIPRNPTPRRPTEKVNNIPKHCLASPSSRLCTPRSAAAAATTARPRQPSLVVTQRSKTVRTGTTATAASTSTGGAVNRRTAWRKSHQHHAASTAQHSTSQGK
jgi:hypothetical protein